MNENKREFTVTYDLTKKHNSDVIRELESLLERRNYYNVLRGCNPITMEEMFQSMMSLGSTHQILSRVEIFSTSLEQSIYEEENK